MQEQSISKVDSEAIRMRRAVVMLSGGQDSTVALYWAKSHYEVVHTITFNYFQRHAPEIKCASIIAKIAGVTNEVINLPHLRGSSPLVDHTIPVPEFKVLEGNDPTFVPGRNIIMLAVAANRCSVLQAGKLVTGFSKCDYDGYPDCRSSFVLAMTKAISYGLDDRVFNIVCPLISSGKKEIAVLTHSLPGCANAVAQSCSDYTGSYPPEPTNHASVVRALGFKEAGLPDPLILRAKSEGLLPPSYPDHGYIGA